MVVSEAEMQNFVELFQCISSINQYLDYLGETSLLANSISYLAWEHEALLNLVGSGVE